MSLEEDKKFIEELESSEGISAIILLQEIVETTIGRKAFETFGVQYPVEFLVWCYTSNYSDLPTHIGYMPAEILGSPEVLLAASIACIRRAQKSKADNINAARAVSDEEVANLPIHR